MSNLELDVIARLDCVSKSFAAVRALDGLQLELQAGEMLALLGPNGAGKTTAIHVLLGLVAADSGHVEVLGQRVVAGQARDCAAVFQQVALPDELSVRELLGLARASVRRPRSLDDCIAIGGLDELIARRYGKLSGGEQRRVQLALAFATRPRLLFLDEPTNAMDRQSRQRLFATLDQLRAEGTAILLSTHVLEEIERHADRLVLIRAGKTVLSGRPQELRERVGQREVRALTTLDDAALLACGHSGPVHREGQQIRLRSSHAESVVREMLNRDPQLSGLQVQTLSLDEVLQRHEEELA